MSILNTNTMKTQNISLPKPIYSAKQNELPGFTM